MALGKKIRIYYDPRGQAIRTVNPDDSFQTVFFGNVTDLEHPENYEPSPWVSFTYDANDNADRRASGPGLTPSTHFNTPKSAEIDALGRTIKTTEHKAHIESGVPYDVVMQYKYDIRGNLLEVTDPVGRTAFKHKYDYANRGLWTEHLDSGGDIGKASTVNMDVMGKPVEATDAKGARVLNSYDVLNRPIRLWAKDNSLAASFTLRQYLIYGDDLTATGYTDTQTKDLNLYGKGWKAFDEAGMVHTEPYDFKGNLIEKNKQVISDSELLSVFSPPPVNWQVNPYIVDWTGLNTSILDSQAFTTTMEYDALNRAMKVTYPEDVNGNRKELTPTYNRAGVLHKVDFDGTEYIKEIAYNAKGQPLLTAYGNSIMTRFVYDENTFRTVRLKTEKYAYTTPSGVHTYTPQSGTTKQDFAYEYDLIGNIMKLHDRTPDSGIQGSLLGTDALDRLFNYDPLYRVIAANGRESTNQNPNILWGDVLPAGTPNANNCQAYNQLFTYDKLGNMMQLQQTGTNAYTRQYVYSSYSTNNKLSQINNSAPVPTVYSNFNYDVNGNMTQSDTDRKYIWDAADQLRAFYIQAGVSEPSVYAQYLYSGGSRSKKIVRTSGGDYEVTVYDGPFEYCKKVSGVTTYEKNYSHIQGAAEIRTGTAFPGDITDSIVYQLPDHLGSSNVRLSTTGAIIDKEEYYPFGDTSLRTFIYKRYRYVGKEKDSESGLYYYGARYYASWTCRFISVDPLADKYAHLTPYNYAGNKPINSIDIDGMQSSSRTEHKTPTQIISDPVDTALNAEYNTSSDSRVTYSVDGLRKYNYAPDNEKSWDYADWEYDKKLGKYTWVKKCLPPPSTASNNIATVVLNGGEFIDKSLGDVTNTIAAARGEETFVRERVWELYDGDNQVKAMAGLGPDATEEDFIRVAKKEYWSSIFEENSKPGPLVSPLPGVFGIPHAVQGQAIEQSNIIFDVLSLGTATGAQKLITSLTRSGVKGILKLFSKKNAFDPIAFSNEIITINKTTQGGGNILSGSPLSSVFSAMYYETAAEQGAAIFRSIISNHLFIDGNKRTAVAAFQSFAKQMGLKTVSENELLNIATKVATGDLTDVTTISKLLIK